MVREGSSVGPALSQDHPDRDREWVESTVAADDSREPSVPIDGAEKTLDVDDLALELDHDERTRRSMPGECVDDAPLAEDRKRNLGQQPPLGQPGEIPGERLVHGPMTPAEHPVELAAAPSSDHVDPDIESSSDGSGGGKPHLLEAAALDPRHGSRRDPGRGREIHLAEPASDPDRSNRSPEALVGHRSRMALGAHRPVVRPRRAAAPM